VDAEKFDKVVLDLLYDELDELTRASAIRHMEQSGKAKALYAELRATKEVGALPLVDPPDDLEAKILDAEARARAGRPLHQRLGGVVSRIASYTMRPQVGMAAVLLLMIGGSMIFLRVKPGEPNLVQVTERGVPESDKEGVALVPVPEAPVAAAPREGSPSRGLAAKKSADGFRGDVPSPGEEARKGGAMARAAPADRRDYPAAAVPAEPFPGASNQMDDLGAVGRAASGAGAFADKDEASSEPAGGPCASLEQELARAASPIESNRARWAVAECYSSVGQNEQARRAYKALLGAPTYAERARRALATLSEPAASSAPVAAAPAAPPPPAAQPKAAAPRAATKPAATAPQTSTEEK
jgi:hypothetical protein